VSERRVGHGAETEQGGFRMAQGFEVLTPKEYQAYSINCEEWDVLKDRVSKLSIEPWLFHTIGSVLLGVASSAFLAILLGVSLTDQERVIAWAIVATAGIAGSLSTWFGQKERGFVRERAADIVTQMGLIETRFDRRSAQLVEEEPPPVVWPPGEGPEHAKR
jgi:hypothetical protein